MKRITLGKFGFIRCPEKDFTDDRSFFQAYTAGKNVTVSKLVSNGQAYLSANSSLGNATLPYEIYSQLPHYQEATWAYNGVPVETLREEDLQAFYDACVAFEQEYEAAEATVQYPTLEEIRDKAIKITAKRLVEISEIETLMSKHLTEAVVKCSAYEWRSVQEDFKNLIADSTRFNPESFPEEVYKTSNSFYFVKPETHMKDSFWFIRLRDLFNKYDMN